MPIVLEEFGIERDGGSFSLDDPTTWRDKFYSYVFSRIEVSSRNGGPFVGSNFWTWGGYGRAAHADAAWREGDASFTGDPPQEAQGLNSVFDTDATTLEVLRAHAEALH
jgi:mannan endo-1,4-beta-mannosidase